MPSHLNRWPGLALTVAVLLAPFTAEAQRWDDLEEALEGRDFIMRPTVEGRRKLYIDAGETETFVLYRGDRLFPLRAAEPVRVIDADAEDDHIELELQSARFGRGRVDFYGRAPTADRFEQWLDEVFEVTTAETDFQRYVGNRGSGVVHIRGANHLPPRPDRAPFSRQADALDAGYSLCGVCFVALPTVSDYETERSLALLGLQEVRAAYYPDDDPERQAYVKRIGTVVLDGWPVPLKGYRYRFQVVDDDDVNAFAVPTGYIFVTSGLLAALETEEELAAILAHEIAHVESRHTYRMWRNSRNLSIVSDILDVLIGNDDDDDDGDGDDVIGAMTSFTAELFLAGHGRDREREADMFASFYLNDADIGDEPLLNSFRKLKFANDAYDPFGGGGGWFASHPDIDERLNRASATITASFPEREVYHGFARDGRLIATLRFDVQRLFRNELDVVATLSTTADLGEDDDVNTLDLRVAGRRLRLQERTAERIFPGDEVSAVFGNDEARGLIQDPIEEVDLELRNVDRWQRATAGPGGR